MKTTCKYCGSEVELTRNRWDPTYYEGYCPKCGKSNWRKLYKCRSCGKYTLHRYDRTIYKDSKNKYGQVSKQPFEIFVCEVCGREKSIYAGTRAPYERSMM